MTGSEKEFSSPKTWDEFLARWRAVKGRMEAVGLLYGGFDSVPYSGGPSYKDWLKRTGFYLDCLNHYDKTIAEIAGQMIIRKCLKQLKYCSVGYDPECLEITDRVLTFLQNPSNAMLKPPHPRFVSEYLLSLHEEWRHGTHPDYQRGKNYQVLQDSTGLIIKALCAWGLSYILARDGLRPEIIPIIKEFLNNRGYQIGEVFMKISGYGEPTADLSDTAGAEKINYAAACAFLKLKYWVGGGFTAEFIRAHPPINLVTNAPKKERAPLGFPKSFDWGKVPNGYVCWCEACNELWAFEDNNTIQQILFGRMKEKYSAHQELCLGAKWRIYKVFDGEVSIIEETGFILGET